MNLLLKQKIFLLLFITKSLQTFQTQLYVLFEHAVGYCLFKVQEFEEIGAFIPQVEEAVKDSTKFMKVVNLAGFRAFKNAAAALENINSISEGKLLFYV